MIRAKQFKESVSLNPSYPWALTAVIGQMVQSFVIGLPQPAHVENKTSIAIAEWQS